jgi:hypothetical protein
MPQSTAALRQKAETLRALRNSQQRPSAVKVAAQGALLRPLLARPLLARPLRARNPWPCSHGSCLALEVREGALWVLVLDNAGQEAWAPIGRILSGEQRREWARAGF